MRHSMRKNLIKLIINDMSMDKRLGSGVAILSKENI
jgi:hypothetical protein